MPRPLMSSSGHQSLEATPLAQPGYFAEIMERVYERDFLPEITNTAINEEIMRCHQEVQIMREPTVGPWRTYQKNQQLVPSQVETDAVSLSICNAAYNCVKFDKTDIWFACERWAQFEEKFKNAIYQQYVNMQRRWVLTSMIAESDPRNRGANAGQFGKIDLGTRGNPVVINKDNVARKFTELQEVLTSQLKWVEGEMFCILPVQFQKVLVESNYANQSWIGDGARSSSVIIDGLWEQQLAGFNIISSISVPHFVDANGRLCFYVIAGHRNAFAYSSNIIEGRLVEPTDSFSVQYQLLAVWGGKCIYPDELAVACWTFE